MISFLRDRIKALREALTFAKQLLVRDKAIWHLLYTTVIKLQSLQKEKQRLELHYRNQLAALSEEREKFLKLVQVLTDERGTALHSIATNSSKAKRLVDFDMLATSVPFPDTIMEKLDSEPLRIIDVGALGLKGQADLYEALYAGYSCDVIAFDPLNVTPVRVENEKSAKLILPSALGDGRKTRFFCTEYPGASSTLRPNTTFLKQFYALPEMLTVREELLLETRRLDDIQEIHGCDLLKIDVQGGQLTVLEGARSLLQEIPMILTEVEFAPVYDNQPLFAEVDIFLRNQGFFLQNLLNPGFSSFKTAVFGDLKSRLMRADAVYIKEPAVMETFKPEKIVKAALIAHVILRNPGLASLILEMYDRKTGTTLLGLYQSQLRAMRMALENQGEF